MSFSKFKEKQPGESENSGSVSPSSSKAEHAFLGVGSKVVGTLNFDGAVELAGEVEGEIVAKKSLRVAESAHVKANITGAEITIFGTVVGDVTASQSLSLKKPARVTGNLTASNLSIEEGVIFDGACKMEKKTAGAFGKKEAGNS